MAGQSGQCLGRTDPARSRATTSRNSLSGVSTSATDDMSVFVLDSLSPATPSGQAISHEYEQTHSVARTPRRAPRGSPRAVRHIPAYPAVTGLR